MPEILLAAVNACYNHTNIAVRSIALYCGAEEKPNLIGFGEWTINQPVGEILRGIAAKEPKVVVFSTFGNEFSDFELIHIGCLLSRFRIHFLKLKKNPRSVEIQ